MKHLRVIDQNGNKADYETELVPRIGERIVLEYGIAGQPITTHYFRVMDVEYLLQSSDGHGVGILVNEDLTPERWPS